MITTHVLDEASGTIAPLADTEEIDGLCAGSGSVVWVDILEPTDADFDMLAHEFGFHELAIEDCRKTHQRPKVEEYKGYYFVVLYEVAVLEEGKSIELRELNIFLGANYLVTVHSLPLRAVDTAARLWQSWSERTEASSGTLAYLLIDAVVDDYMPLLDDLTERVEDIGDQIITVYKPEMIHEIFRMKKQLLFLRRSTAPLRDVFNVILRREQAIFPREIHAYFQDVYDHLIRVTDNIDTLRDMLGSTMDVYLSMQGNRMNVVMKRLTSISAILMSVTLVAGIYGMNFEGMPELHWRYGYVFALSSMVAIGIAMYYYFRKIDWL